MPKVQPSGSLNVWLPLSILESLLAEAQRRAPFETGGVLLGYWGRGPREPVVTQALGPGPGAIHEKFRFVPDYTYHVNEIARLFESSDGDLEYLGDWHTHPEGSGQMSRKDRKALKNIATDPGARASRPLMLILSGGPDWRATVWLGEVVRHRLFGKAGLRACSAATL